MSVTCARLALSVYPELYPPRPIWRNEHGPGDWPLTTAIRLVHGLLSERRYWV